MTEGPDHAWSPENAAYWEATRAGQLLIRHCTACGKPHYYPRPLCPFCGSAATEWIKACGRGTVYSYTIVRKAASPYVPAYVTLNEGVTMLTHIVDCDPERVSVGDEVRLVFRQGGDGRVIPMFIPDGSDP